MFTRMISTVATIGAALVCCSFTYAQDLNATEIPDLEVDRSLAELDRGLAERHPDSDIFNTAIVFTSYQNSVQLVRCAGFDANGNLVGRTRTRVPADGARLILSSDISNGTDYLGKISCASRGDVFGSAFLLGPEFNDLPVINDSDRAGSFIRVPVSLSR